MEIKGSKVFVTGAGGFIGSHLCERLVLAGASVTGMLHYSSRPDNANLDLLPPDILREIEIIKGDVQDLGFLNHATNGVDIVFHLAALIGIPYSYIAPNSYIMTNVMGTANLLEASRQNEVSRFIHTSTSETYGTAQYTPIDENHPLQGQSPYSASKIGADKFAESYHSSFELPVVTVRPFNCYGPRQSNRAIIPTIISQALSKTNITLGDLTPIRDFTYVSDTVNGFIKASITEEAIGKVLNLGNGKGISVGELATLIIELMEVDASIVSDSDRIRPKNSEVKQLLCDSRLASDLLDWTPRVSFREGLKEVIQFVRDNASLFEANKYVV